jgi:UDP-glucose 4-epimerase
VKIMVDNIEQWRGAPVWTPERIADATASWFAYLGREAALESSR